MTNALTIGIDPGLSGALACIDDAGAVEIFDLPTEQASKKPTSRKRKPRRINAAEFANTMRFIRSKHQGADLLVCVEAVWTRPQAGNWSASRASDTAGVIRGVLAALGVRMVEVSPMRWKRFHGLTGTEKHAALGLAKELFPTAGRRYLGRQKDIDRADALLIADFAREEFR